MPLIETCLTGDFNGKSLRQCEFTGKSLLCKDNQSYNGIRLLQFSEASELDIVNTFNREVDNSDCGFYPIYTT
jgi:hypothetical protein